MSSSESYSDWSPASSASSSSSTRSSPVHAASLVDPATHSPAIMQLIDIKLSRPVLEYVVECVAETVDYAMGRSDSESSRGRSITRTPHLSTFTTFVSNILTRAEVSPATVLVSLAYISRARPHLSIALEQWALERVFLGALIIASKYTNDSTLKNVHWALCTGVFGKRDIGRIEREFLDVLDWELGISEDDILAHHEGLLRAAYASTRRQVVALPTTKTHVKSASASSSSSDLLTVPRPSRPTHHRHSSHDAGVPELCTSPASSAASMSPRTPLTAASSSASSSTAVSPAHAHHDPAPIHKDDAVVGDADVPMEDVAISAPLPLASHPVSAKSGDHAGHHKFHLHDILRSFQFPRHHHHRQHDRHQQHHPQIRVVAA